MIIRLLLFLRLAQIVLELRPEMRSWKIKCNGPNIELFLNNLADKGISELKHFKLNFEHVWSRESLDLVDVWKDHIYEISIGLKSPFPLQLRNLEALYVHEPHGITGQNVKHILNAHSGTLKRLFLKNT